MIARDRGLAFVLYIALSAVPPLVPWLGASLPTAITGHAHALLGGTWGAGDVARAALGGLLSSPRSAGSPRAWCWRAARCSRLRARAPVQRVLQPLNQPLLSVDAPGDQLPPHEHVASSRTSFLLAAPCPC